MNTCRLLVSWLHGNCGFASEQLDRDWPWEDFGHVLLKTAQATPKKAPASIVPYDVVVIRRTPVGESTDARPAVVTRVLGDGTYEVVPITSQFGLSNRNPGDFEVHPTHENFGPTGLRKPSIIRDIPMIVTEVLKIGHLSGRLLTEFLDQSGRVPAKA